MRKFLKYIGLLLLVFFGVATLISLGCLYTLRNSSFYKPPFLANAVPQTEFDYIVLGSSVGLTTLDTKLMDSINHTTGINLSMDDTGMSSQFLMLQHFLAEGKKTKYCILAPGIAALENKTVNFGDNDYRFLMFVNRDYVYDYYKNASSISCAAQAGMMTKWLPFIGLSYYNTEVFYPSLNAMLKPTQRNRFDEKGNYSYPKRKNKFKEKPLRILEMDFEHPYLEKIEALCKANDIQLIYYFAPTRAAQVTYSDPGFPVINHSQVLKDDSLFYDDIHVNYIGREKVSTLFAEFLYGIFKDSDHNNIKI